ncbi:MAG: amino acid ABC transporter permease [Acidimicrobiales bacterium]|nr:MAG: amino acid ABC transporter permease [Acidimicrobiales bacterium]
MAEQRRVDPDPLELNQPEVGRPPGIFAQEGFKSSLIAVVSTVVVFGGGALLIVNSPNWPKVRDQYFSGEDFRASWPKVLDGFWVNLELFAYSTISIAIVALVVAVMRSFRGAAFFPLRALATIYTDIFRGIPLILLILLIGFGLPALDIGGVPRSATFWGIVALTLSYSAYTAEIYRSGIDAVPESQRSSARALGLTQWQSLRFAILPQAVRNVVPALMNTVVSLQKDVALISILGVREAVREAQIYTARTFNYTSYVVATLLFLAISIPLTRVVDWYTARDRRLRSQAPV